MFSVEISRKAEKAVENLPKEISKRIVAAIEKLRNIDKRSRVYDHI